MFHCLGDEPVKRKETAEKGEARTKDEAQEKERERRDSKLQGRTAGLMLPQRWGELKVPGVRS